MNNTSNTTYILRSASGRTVCPLMHQARDFRMKPATNYAQAEKAAMRESDTFRGETADIIEVKEGVEQIVSVLNF